MMDAQLRAGRERALSDPTEPDASVVIARAEVQGAAVRLLDNKPVRVDLVDGVAEVSTALGLCVADSHTDEVRVVTVVRAGGLDGRAGGADDAYRPDQSPDDGGSGDEFAHESSPFGAEAPQVRPRSDPRISITRVLTRSDRNHLRPPHSQ